MHTAANTQSTTANSPPTSPRTTDTLTIGVFLAFAALLVFIATSAAFALANLRTVYGAADAVAHTNAVKAQLASLLATLVDAETGERGYIITNRTSYLDPYDRAVAATEPEIEGLRALLSDSPDQRTDLFQLSTLSREKLAETATAIERRHNAGFDEAQAVVLTNIGKQTMDEMRAIVARMDGREDAVLLARTAEATAAYRAARLTSVGVAAVGLIVSGGLFMATRRVGRQRRLALNLAGELRVTLAELQTAVTVRDNFLSIASHELRNPVNAVQLQLIGVLRALQRAGGVVHPDDIRERVERANAQVGRLTRLMDNLLDVSRMGAGSLELEPEPVNLVDLVQTVIGQFHEEAAPGQITFVAERPVVGHWDRLRVEQIVSNLVSNAIKYGNGQPILVSLDADAAAARLSVQDQGIGIAPDDQARLFARFERGVSSKQYGGFGLGLWIARQLIDAMGGSISVDSRPGQGATFSIVLPLGQTIPTHSKT